MKAISTLLTFVFAFYTAWAFAASGSISLNGGPPLPSNGFGSAGQCLETDGVSTTSWGSCGGSGTTASGINGQVQLSDGAGNLTDISGFSYLSNVLTAAGLKVSSLGAGTLLSDSSGNITSGTAAIAHGGTGATSKAGAFDALSPMSASGDIIYGGTSGTGTRLPKGTDGQIMALVSGLPAWINNSGGVTNPVGDVIYKAPGQAFTCGVYTNAVPFTSSDAVSGSDTSMLGTANKFTAQHTGIHLYTISVSSSSFAGSDHWLEIGFSVNGGGVQLLANNFQGASATRRNQIAGSAFLFLTAGDTVTSLCNPNTAGNGLDEYRIGLAEIFTH